MYGNRNRLEEQKSKFAPAEVPLHLINAINDVEAEIGRIGIEISDVKRRLAEADRSRIETLDPQSSQSA